MIDRACWRCEHWDSVADIPKKHSEGYCCVDPPMVVLGSAYGTWPRTFGSNWCGQFGARLEQVREALKPKERDGNSARG